MLELDTFSAVVEFLSKVMLEKSKKSTKITQLKLFLTKKMNLKNSKALFSSTEVILCSFPSLLTSCPWALFREGRRGHQKQHG